jgi:CelD/BcsL family acetyltransferase involved in cellulose biosynthesis
MSETAGAVRLRLETTRSLEPLRSDWMRLAEATSNVFSTWEWASTWWRHFGSGRLPLIVACRTTDGRLTAILPLYAWASSPLRIVRLIGHGPADELGPLCAPHDRALAANGLKQALSELDADVLLGEQLAGGPEWDQWLSGHLVRREASPSLATRGRRWDDYLDSRSANFRQQIRARERRLARRHRLCFRLTREPERLQRDLDVLFDLHRARWRAAPTAFVNEAFHREFAARALERGWLRLWILELDGAPAGAWYGFRFAGIECFYQSGRDPRWESDSVGLVLLAHTVRTAFEDGAREYRFLRGDEPYKYRFAEADTGVDTVAVGNGRLGRIIAAAGAGHLAAARLRRRVRSAFAESPTRPKRPRSSRAVRIPGLPAADGFGGPGVFRSRSGG